MLPRETLKKIKRLELKTSRLVEGVVAGSYLSSFKGRGIEFTEVREYAEGDDVRAIDWNVTARMGAPFVKTFMEERDLTVMLAVDLSGSMEFGTTANSKRELALELSAAASLIASMNNDRVGLIAYTDRVELFIPPRKGRRHVMRLLAGLESLKTKGHGSDARPAAGFILKALKGRAIVFWVSDFIGVDGPGEMKAVSMRHEVVPALLRDRREDEIPDVGLAEFIDPETGGRVVVDTSSEAFRDAYAREASERDKRRASIFRALKSEPVELWTGADVVVPLARYFRRKALKRGR